MRNIVLMTRKYTVWIKSGGTSADNLSIPESVNGDTLELKFNIGTSIRITFEQEFELYISQVTLAPNTRVDTQNFGPFRMILPPK